MNTHIKRINNTNLPDTNELATILEREVKRVVPVNKLKTHYPQFETIIALFSHYSLPTEIFINNSFTIYDVVTLGESVLNQFIDIITVKPITESDVLLFDNVYDYLSEEDELQKSDIIFVFGGKTSLRAEKAAELYKKGFGKIVLVSGGRPIYVQEHNESEANKYKDILMKHDIPLDHILLEDKSITVADNVRRSLNLLDELKMSYRSIILVTSPYAQRRGWATFKKYLPDSITLYRVNSVPGDQITKENWYKQNNTLRIVLNEFIKMRASTVYNTA